MDEKMNGWMNKYSSHELTAGTNTFRRKDCNDQENFNYIFKYTLLCFVLRISR